MSYKTLLSGQIFTFDSVKEVLAKANEEKSGDVLAGVAAKSGLERIAAKEVLSQMTLEELRQNPAVPYEEDEVTRLNQDGINETIYGGIKSWTVGELREWLMAYTTGEEEIRRGWDRLCVLAMDLTETTGKEAIELAEHLRDLGYMPQQVQDFYPTPSTISTCMYYTGYDCRTMEKVYVPTNPHEKAMQRALIQYRNPKNYDLVMEALKLAGRTDLIGFDKKCLIRPKDGNPYGRHTRGGDAGGKGKNTPKPRPKKTIRNVHKKKGT